MLMKDNRYGGRQSDDAGGSACLRVDLLDLRWALANPWVRREVSGT